jgi:hypothetical protein
MLIISTLEEYYLKKTLDERMTEIFETKFSYNTENEKIIYKKLEADGTIAEIEVNDIEDLENEENFDVKKDIEKELKITIQENAQKLIDDGIAFSMMKKLANKNLYETTKAITEEVTNSKNELVTNHYEDSEIGVQVDFGIRNIKYVVDENGNREIISGDIPVNGRMTMDSAVKFISRIKVKYAYPMVFEFFEHDTMDKNGEKVKRLHFVHEFIQSM